ncbi:MAG: SEL1-like repeat protein, partial [Opitutales bacterium]|nr:SEL1-like repeat protein [Opitutales bacterium]
YLKGHGVPKDPEEAARWMQKAAEQGDEDAQRFLKDFESSSTKEEETSGNET